MENHFNKQFEVKSKGYSEIFNEMQNAQDKYLELKKEVLQNGGQVFMYCRLVDNANCAPLSDWLLIDSIRFVKKRHHE